ncbi:Os06g0150500 [Oryza sativa Japonica Group]|uniref:Os06g0150500 protein n=2 Tax=Oryza sativa subsp. japonica TaxID=39947 RepID=A0A0P0WSC2_ORYSJ|nr:hypothetical protein EE612_031955 [Oryza sativa]BAD69049.1 unknown protein [Oryza sativa Japonica Group]BAD69313.1 unknown protein [Oryza sativa Japonica Group]BAF18739.1 Os06g0150500 [Oryza sativa Japonica Group]BAS96184.1 Os06g0150500 [Oryza sativa Japonica Group]|eukprot:NP_001056825.1 Os06g0150500 [Oryza sativa Japonica Group]
MGAGGVSEPQARRRRRLQQAIRAGGLHHLQQPRPQPRAGEEPRPVAGRAGHHRRRCRPQPAVLQPRHDQPRLAEPHVAVDGEREQAGDHHRRAPEAEVHRLRPLPAVLERRRLLRLHPVHQLLEPVPGHRRRDRRAHHARHGVQRRAEHLLHARLAGGVGHHVPHVPVQRAALAAAHRRRLEPLPAVDDPRHPAVGVGVADGTGEELPHVRAERHEAGGAPAAAAAGRRLLPETLEVGGLDAVQAPLDGRRHEGIDHGGRREPRELLVQRRAEPRRRPRHEQGSIEQRLAGEPPLSDHLPQGVEQHDERPPVGEEVIRRHRQREPAAREPDQLQRQREARVERHAHQPDRAVDLREVNGREGHGGVGHDELGTGVVAGDLGDVRRRVPHDAAGEGEEVGEVRRERGADGGHHGGDAARRGSVDGDEVDGEGAEDEVKVGDGEDGREAWRRARRPDKLPGGDLEVEAP